MRGLLASASAFPRSSGPVERFPNTLEPAPCPLPVPRAIVELPTMRPRPGLAGFPRSRDLRPLRSGGLAVKVQVLGVSADLTWLDLLGMGLLIVGLVLGTLAMSRAAPLGRPIP